MAPPLPMAVIHCRQHSLPNLSRRCSRQKLYEFDEGRHFVGSWFIDAVKLKFLEIWIRAFACDHNRFGYLNTIGNALPHRWKQTTASSVNA
jgi:hypothetical protein